MKVYLIWRGEYSNRDVMAVAATDEIANKIAQIYDVRGYFSDSCYITECDLKTEENFLYEKEMRVTRECGHTEVEDVENIGYCDRFCEVIGDVYEIGSNEYEVWVTACTQDDAIKKADELFEGYFAINGIVEEPPVPKMSPKPPEKALQTLNDFIDYLDKKGIPYDTI